MTTNDSAAAVVEAEPFMQTSLRLPVAMHAELLTRAAQEDRSVSATVRAALRRYLAEAPQS